jgi:hypothetical protein
MLFWDKRDDINNNDNNINENSNDNSNDNNHNSNDNHNVQNSMFGGAKSPEKDFTLELGDLIEIIAPTNLSLHEQTFYILYIDNRLIELVNVSTYQFEKLSLNEHSTITDESVTEIYLLDRSDVTGYARQHKLLPKTWIDIYFGGEQPSVITCVISDLEEDRIELTTYPDNEVIYIDFEYKGLPKHIPIEKILIRDEPVGAKKLRQMASDQETGEQMEGHDEPSMEWTEEGESIIHIPDGTKGDENFHSLLHNIYLDANELFGEDLGVVFRKQEITDKERQYTIEAQVNDMVDEYLAPIPNSKRTAKVMQHIHRLVERFKELREQYSQFDENGLVSGIKKYGSLYKPLVNSILQLDHKLKWIMPVTTIYKRLYSSPSTKSDYPEEYEPAGITSEDVSSDENQSGISQDVKEYKEKELFKDIINAETNYFENNSVGNESKYRHYMKTIFEKMQPFDTPPNNTSFLEYEKEIKMDLESIIDNYDYCTTTYKKEAKIPTKYFIQRYNLGLKDVKSLEYSKGVKVYVRDNLNPNEKVSIKSLILLPEPVVRYSHTTLPSTNILTKTEMSHWGLYLYRIFHKKLSLDKHIITDLNKEIDYEELESLNENDLFLSKIKEYVLDETLVEDRDKYEKMLKTIVPRIRTLVRLMKKYIKDKISMVDIIKNLEPFMVYSDNITYEQFKEIRYFIKEKIVELRKRISEMGQEYSKILNTNYNSYKHPQNRGKVASIHNAIESMFYEKHDLHKTMLNHYINNKTHFYSSSEELQHIIASDGGILYANLMTFMLLSLVTPKKILNLEEDELESDDADANEKIRKSGDCSRKYLAKKYVSLEQLQKDNSNPDIYYDTEYDDTPYYILKKYEEDKKKMLKEKFTSYLAEILVQKHGCPRDQSDELANTLIEGKKKVSNGEYAVIMLKPTIADPELRKKFKENKLSEKEKAEIEMEERVKTKLMYYKRVNHVWMRDDSIGEENFYDTNDLFCNASLKCNKNVENNVCESVEHASQRIKEKQAQQAMNEFDKRFQISMEELKTYLETHIYENQRVVSKNHKIRENAIYKHNFVWYKLGESYRGNNDQVFSKHLKLLNLIMGQTDFATKQDNILKFVNYYCREFLPEQREDIHWYYCIETNTKLIPRSVVQLAEAFVSGTYLETLDVLCHQVGIDSEDSIVDKYSGFVLKKKDLVAQDTYDDTTGFKITTHAIIEKDFAKLVEENNRKETEKNKAKVYNDETSQMVFNVMHTICNNMGISTTDMEEFIVSKSLSLINDENIVMTEKKYKKIEQLREKENKPALPPYSIYKPQVIIMIVGSITLVAIQTSIPSIKTSKTFPRCVKSFVGYPLEGVEDRSSIKYIACVIKGSESSIPPWNSIKGTAGKKEKVSVKTVEDRIFEILSKHVMPRNEIINLFLKKREYLELNPENEIAETHAIHKWIHFLPPVVEYTIDNKMTSLSPDFNEHILSLIRKSNSIKTEIHMYSTNVMRNTYHMVELINKVVKTKSLELKMGSVYPLQNACCNEKTKKKHPLYYFIDEDNNVEVSVKRGYQSNQMLSRINNITSPVIFYNDEPTRILPPPLPSGIINDNIYKAYIHYCNFDNDQPISDDLSVVCAEKPDKYDKTASLEEKIDFLKRTKNYDVNSLHSLMGRVNIRNQIHLYNEKQILQVNMFKDIIDSLEMRDSIVVEEPLRRILKNVLDKYDSNKMHPVTPGEMTPFQESIYMLRNYLTVTNNKLFKQIMGYIKIHGNVDTREMDKIEDFFENIAVWEIDGTDSTDSASMHTVVNFIKNAIYFMTRSIPNSITHNSLKISLTNTKWTWGLIPKYVESIEKFIADYNGPFHKFVNNEVITKFLRHIDVWSREIIMMMDNIPVYSSISKENETFFSLFDKRTIYLLYTYLLYSTYYEFMETSNDSELLSLEIKTKNANAKKRMQEEDDINIQMDSVQSAMDETKSELGDIMDDMGNELEEIQIVAGEQNTLKNTVCDLLLCFIRTEMKNKKTVDKSYENVVKKMTIVKKQEKKAITDMFENLDRDERNIEFLFKKHKIDKWNVNVLGLYSNEKEAIMANKVENELDMALEMAFAKDGAAEAQQEAQSYDVDELERMQEMEQSDLYDKEAFDFGHYRDDYMDGVYYEEDMEHDDFGDD